MKKKNQKRYYAVLVIQDSDNRFEILKSKEFNPLQQLIEFKSKSETKKFYFDISFPTYCKNLEQYYLFNWINQQQILFNNTNQEIINTEIYDLIMEGKIIKQLSSAMRKDKFNWSTFLMGLFAGVTGGLITMFIIINVMNETGVA
jgi:hypothetical protein